LNGVQFALQLSHASAGGIAGVQGGQLSRLTGGNDSVWAARAACSALGLVPELAVIATAVNARLPAVTADRMRNFLVAWLIPL
jgi:hypothetical protein